MCVCVSELVFFTLLTVLEIKVNTNVKSIKKFSNNKQHNCKVQNLTSGIDAKKKNKKNYANSTQSMAPFSRTQE